MEISNYIARISEVARATRSASKLEGEFNRILKECLRDMGMAFDPHVNETLKEMGLSQVDAYRPDGVFGHIVYDYKAPGFLSNTKRIQGAQKQLERYLNRITGGHSDAPESCTSWFGYITDGRKLFYCRSNQHSWQWSHALPLTETTLLFLLHAYRSLERKPLTAQLLSEAFGKESVAARELIQAMCSHLSKPQHKTDMLFREWKRLFQQVSTVGIDQLPSLKQWATENEIETKEASQILFAMHTYYSLVVKILTSELLSISSHTPFSVCEKIIGARNLDELNSVLMQIENGDYYRRYRISNFLEGDFFSWTVNERSRDLARCIRGVARQFLEFEPASPILMSDAPKDLLKVFYSSLLDEQIRHDLGEYYTPDWLAQHLLDCAGYHGDPNCKVLDPACGSGTFLVEAIIRLKQGCREVGLSSPETLTTILNNVKGLDLNPLAVLSARANYIFAICDLVFELGHDIELPVYLSDSIHVPVEKEDEEGQRYLDRLARFYERIEALEARGFNNTGCRILKNNFSPSGFDPFDLIIGNPPWVRWSRLPETYRDRVKAFCDHYGLVSGRGYAGGIETDISTVITFSAADHWLKDGGTLAFLITWTVFKSASARGFRLSRLPGNTGLRITRLEDLTRLQPFPDAANETAIYIAKKVPSTKTPFRRTECKLWFPQRGRTRIPAETPLEEVYASCEIRDGIACPVREWGTPLFTGDLSHYRQSSFLRGKSEYLSSSHRGTISDCARVYWVKVLQYSEATNRALIRTLTREELPRAREIDPVDGIWIEADLLYPLLRGRDVGRYCTQPQGWHQLIPNSHYENVTREEEFADRYPLAHSYLKSYEAILRQRSSYKRYQSRLPFYVVYCVGEYSFSPFKVVWMEQQDPKAFRAAVLSSDPNAHLPNALLVPDHKLYFASFASENEAHYVCGFLNASPVRTWLGGFMLGKQIGTTVFEYMNVPQYDEKNSYCQAIARISCEAHRQRLDTRDKTFLDESKETKLQQTVHELCSKRKKR